MYHCSFVLLAEFDIDRGAMLTYQFPQPLGTDELLLANLMLPDGAEKQLEDWTIFFLNQTPFNRISPVLALETPESDDGVRSELLYVLNLVRTKHDKSVRRGAVVKAMAICTRHSFIQIFKPVLLMALDDYFSDPSQDCLARLFDAVNAMDISAAPVLTRNEKFVMRASERKDIFAEKFSPFISSSDNPHRLQAPSSHQSRSRHRPSNSMESASSFEDGILIRTRERDRESHNQHRPATRPRTDSGALPFPSSATPAPPSQNSPDDSSFNLGGSAVWVGDESSIEIVPPAQPSHFGSFGSSSASGSTIATTNRGRRSTDASSASSHFGTPTLTPAFDHQFRPGVVKDTHFYHTSIAYKEHLLPIKMPLSTFPEEVGEYSLITLIQAFPSAQNVSGPLHPHLHTNGSLTHPIIILFNALLTGKRVIFLGHNRPAGQVSTFVLTACALGSGCGAVLRGLIERAFPYANLTNRDEWESVPAYIAGVTNPIFESSGSWDVLFDIGTSRVIVSKDINTNCPPNTSGSGTNAGPATGSGIATSGAAGASRSGPLKAEGSLGSEDDAGRVLPREGRDASQASRTDFVAKADSPDNLFIEDIVTAISYHFGERVVRMRFTEYVVRFVRLATRYEEETFGATQLNFPTSAFSAGASPQLGSGFLFSDDAAGMRELAANASRIEGWRKTNTYQYCLADFARYRETCAIRGFDLMHQLVRLRLSKNIPDAEVELIMRSIAENSKSYEQVVELLAHLAPHGGGLMYLSLGLFHQQESIRERTVDILTELRTYPVGVIFLQGLNHFLRYAYVRQAHTRGSKGTREQQQQQPQPQPQQPQQQHLQPPTIPVRTPSNRSETSLGNVS